MPKLHEMIESKYLRKEDIQEDGEVLVTLIRVEQVNVALDDQPKEMKWAAWFHEFAKPMVLNSTNLQLLAKALGSDDSDDWLHKKVVIYVDDNVSFGGKLVGGIRVRASRRPAAPPAARRPAPPPPEVPGGVDAMEDDTPF